MPRHASPALAESDPLTLAAGTWLACGMVLYGLTPVPLHDATLGWSPAFWLLAAPLLLLVAKHLLVPWHLRASSRRRAGSPRRARVRAKRHSGAALAPRPARETEHHGSRHESRHAATPFLFASMRRSNSRMMY